MEISPQSLSSSSLLPTPLEVTIAVPTGEPTTVFESNSIFDSPPVAPSAIARPILSSSTLPHRITQQIFAICLLAVSALCLIVGLAYLYRVSLGGTKERERKLGLSRERGVGRWDIEAMTPPSCAREYECADGALERVEVESWCGHGELTMVERVVLPVSRGSQPSWQKNTSSREATKPWIANVGGMEVDLNPERRLCPPPPAYDMYRSRLGMY